ncbi:membrane-bound lytic murein transglycosylase B-like protein [Saccharothrix espanaensis DSM 44229]|uniref:Membrane-bound lytic murein transglycosylase B-like protein n=1 Tax=Saccharothrix espanaensis (strain ATCC 51144 / DSM 44229 / JCM 9112 / NBRC 15066 / NRRL 15764) TaxID=1179773 RepID=K0JNZ8_SACES|nr:membrane-bound lytic murein transglycosylase B-like protein [Saccharothrix espanaensis DSM 44229]
MHALAQPDEPAAHHHGLSTITRDFVTRSQLGFGEPRQARLGAQPRIRHVTCGSGLNGRSPRIVPVGNARRARSLGAVVVPPPEKTTPPPPHRGRVGNLVGRLALVALLLAVVAGGAWGLSVFNRREVQATDPPFPVPFQEVEPGSAAPDSAGQVPPQASVTGETAAAEPLTAWAVGLSAKIDVPARALRAYAIADLIMRSDQPSCRISWATLAGIGRIESHHGTIGGLKLGEDGRPSKPIIGIPLDGSPGVKAIQDSDGGVLDQDTTWDRAVGPMQFIPTTWARYAVRANGDGNPPDPQNIDDAALAAARYLCSDGRDLATGDGWWTAVMAYNNSVEYGQNVYSGADAYARASQG